MESINETPAKRRKLCGSASTEGYDSQTDSGDETFEAYNTVETVPLPRKQTQQSTWVTDQHVTQPTQIIHHGSPCRNESVNGRLSPIVQVKASSPTSSVTSPNPTPPKPQSLPLNTIAPAGTVFRAPAGIVKPPLASIQNKNILDLSDDDIGPTYQGGSSDEESQLMKADIKPSSFVTKAQKSNHTNDTERFKKITSNAIYDPDQTSKSGKTAMSIRSSDILASAYGGIGRKLGNLSSSAKTAQAVPAERKPIRDIPLISIPDYQLRDKIKRMQTVLPSKSVLQCRDALLNKKNNYDDAVEYLLVKEESAHIDLTVDEDNSADQQQDQSQSQLHRKNTAKQHIKAPIKKIHEKWTFTQQRTEPVSSPSQNVHLKESTVLKPRRRLVQGRKRVSSPAAPPSRATSTPRSNTPKSEDFDSGLGEGSRDSGLESQALEFFNSCSGSDLADIAAISSEIAQSLLAKRPFSSLNGIRKISDQPPKDKKLRKAKLIGDRIVDKCLEMWAGYEAVDNLVRRCKDLAQPLQAAMGQWGIDVYGMASKKGELEIVEIDELSGGGGKDSGIGTPSSRSVSVDRDLDGDTPKILSARKPIFFGQPSNMANDVVLKDYQIVGMNWLSLLFEQGQKLSHDFGAILADDMGLGKTCQVVAFLAHLMERGIGGPHLVVVPGSTLENWLREFRTFCPRLNVRPYYASQSERPEIRQQIENDRGDVNVVITTYTIAKMKDDNKFLRKLRPVSCVYDEGHMLRNSSAAGYEAYMRIPTKFRLLLTGTPLQNNLRELVSLLGFILPSVFKEHSEDLEVIFSHKAKTTNTDESHATLLSTQRISRAKSMMAPFVLRRKKHQVLRQLPAKHRRVVYCDMSESQVHLYEAQKAKARQTFVKRKAGESTANESANILMSLRKASLHPLLFRRLFCDDILRRMASACLREDEFRESDADLVYEDMTVMDGECFRGNGFPSSVDSGVINIFHEL